MKLDLLAIGAHPDDVELSCSGTLVAAVQQGKKVGVLDLTRGELGTRGTPEIRDQEANEAARIMGLSVRMNAEFRDGFFANDEEHQLRLIRYIRAFQPEVILANAIYDRHPDHGRAAKLIEESFFKAGLSQLETTDDQGNIQQPWRPRRLFHYIQSVSLEPDFLVDISSSFPVKMEAIRAYRSQFYDPDSKEPETYISSQGFMAMIEARARELGQRIGVDYGEGFTTPQPVGVSSIFDVK